MASRRSLNDDDVSLAARIAGVPPELALAVWQQESSSGRNTKTSPKGAVGGFQVIPDTFKRYVPDGDINDPVDNMQAGLAVLRDGLKQAGGDFEKAAQFYYHGKVLPPGIEGPTSGPGTPTTREYGRQVANRAYKLAGNNKAPPTTMASLATTPANQTFTDISTPDIGADLFGIDEDEDSLSTDYEEEPDQDEEAFPQMAGLTTSLNPQNYMMGGSADGMMNDAGSMNYELDKYIRGLVDEELKA